jgi:hypothetical protein
MNLHTMLYLTTTVAIVCFAGGLASRRVRPLLFAFGLLLLAPLAFLFMPTAIHIAPIHF